MKRKTKTPLLLRLIRWIYPPLERFFPRLAERLFVTIFFTPLNYTVPGKEKVLERQAEKFTVNVGRKRIQCYAWGQGPVVVLLHGWAGRATQFRKLIPAFVAEGFRVVGFDGPAHGRSGGVSTDIVEFEAALRAVTDYTGPPQAMIAHSFGGSVALYAAMNGLPVNKLINIASPTIGDEIIRTYLKAIGGSWRVGEAFKSYVLRRTGKPFDAFTALHFVRHLPATLALLLVHDEDDVEVSIDHALALVKAYPQARLVKTSGLGHTRILRDEKVIETCLSFVKS